MNGLPGSRNKAFDRSSRTWRQKWQTGTEKGLAKEGQTSAAEGGGKGHERNESG